MCGIVRNRFLALTAGIGAALLLQAVAAQAAAQSPFDARWRGTISCGPGVGTVPGSPSGPHALLPLDIPVDTTVSAGRFKITVDLRSGLHAGMDGRLTPDGQLSLQGEAEPPSGAPRHLPIRLSGAANGNIVKGSGTWGNRDCTILLATDDSRVAASAGTTPAPEQRAATREPPTATLTRAPDGALAERWQGSIECNPAKTNFYVYGGFKPLSIPVETRIEDGKFSIAVRQSDGLRGEFDGVVEAGGRLIMKGEAQGAGGPRADIVTIRGAMKGNVIDGRGTWGERDCTMRLTAAEVRSAANSPSTPSPKPDVLAKAIDAAQSEQERREIEAERQALKAEKQKLAQAAAQFEQQRRDEQARLAQAMLAEQEAKTAAAEAERQRQEAESLSKATQAKQQAEQAAEQQRQRAQIDFDPGRYFALVIGNNNYKSLPKLQTAIGDAKAVANLLREKYGFQVTVLNDATRYQTLTALTKLRAQLKFEDNLLIYYAGHGVLDEAAERGYWLPVDAEANNPSNWVSTVDLTDSLRAMEARHVMIVADSCYSGTLLRGVATAPRPETDRRVWLKRMEEKRSRTALTSGGLEPVMDGGGSGHSVFTKALIDVLTENTEPIDGQALFGLIRRPVVLNADQTPAYADIRSAGHDGGDFILVPAALRRGGQKSQ